MATFLQPACKSNRPDPVRAENRALARTWIELLNQHDTTGLGELYSDSAKLFSPNWNGFKTGPAGARETYGRYFQGTPDLRHRISRIVVTDSTAVVEYISQGTFQNPEKGTPDYMKGKQYKLENCTRLDISKGKITEQMNYFDQVSFLRQVGFFDQRSKQAN